MANDSWSGLTPENDKIWEQLWDKYVPTSGQAETIGGEILRAMARIIYRYYNDGDMVGVGYGNETCNSSDRYLDSTIKDYESLDQFSEGQYDEYEKLMLKNHRTVFQYLQDNPILFEQESHEDSREANEEDYRRSRDYDGYDDYEQYDEETWEE